MRPYQVRRSKHLLLLLLASLTMYSSMAQDSTKHEFSAKEAVDYALKNSSRVKNALTDVKIQLQTNREVTSAALPQVTGYVSGTDYFDIPSSLLPGVLIGQPGTYIPVQFGVKYNATYGLDLKQMLFDGQVFVGLQARAASIEYANMNVAVTQEMIKANIYKIYYQLVVAKKQVQIFDINIERTEKLLHDTKELYKNGFQEKLDVDKVNVNLSNIRTDKLKVENRIKTGYTALKYLMGMPVTESLVLTDTLNEANLRQVLLEADTSQYQNRREYQLLKVTEKLGQYNIKRYKMSYLPTVSLSAAYAQNAQRQTFDFFKGGEPWFKSTYIGLRIDVPIFDGFAKDSRIKKAKLELQKTQTTMADLKNNIATEIDTARTSLQSALVVLDEQQKNMSLAEQVYNQTKKKYEQGLGSNLEVTNAEADLKTAQNNYFSALYDAVVARIEYLRATGQLQ